MKSAIFHAGALKPVLIKEDVFDPTFDDRAWTENWLHVPIIPVPPATHPSGYRIGQAVITEADVFGRSYYLSTPLDLRTLFDPEGRMWMSSTPQEMIMMFNNGRASFGHVLVGGLGLGLYLQYAEIVGAADRFTVIEASPVIRDLVQPTMAAALSCSLEVRIGDIEAALSGPVDEQFDTIFLDTWDTLDAAHLPYVNRLRDLAIRHLSPGGRVLLWGYGWMLELFETACRQLLSTPPDQRRNGLSGASQHAHDLLHPVLAHFEGQIIEDIDGALRWCREYVVRRI